MASPWYANPSPTYQPAMRLISSISKAVLAEIKTTFDHDFVSGTIVRIHMPRTDVYGMPQIDKLSGAITVTGTDTFTMDIDTTLFQALVIPTPIPAHTQSYPYVIPIGQINSILTASVRNVLPY